ncbi:MAG: anthrone oxygenase family protein [Aeromicrobium sp.]
MTRGSLLVAVTLTGLSAGLFATFSYAVMPGLRRTDDASFVQTMRAMNVAILNPVFVLVFVGAGVAAVVALASGWRSDARPWLVAGLALYVVGAYVVTAAVNVPLNDALAAGTSPAAELRAAFEDRWIVVNHVRSLLTTAAFVCLVIGSVTL